MFASIILNGECLALRKRSLNPDLNSIDSVRLGGEVSKVFPDVLLAAMDIIYSQYKTLKGRDGYTFNTDENKERVTMYAGYMFGHLNVALFIAAIAGIAGASESNHQYGCHCPLPNARRHKHAISSDGNFDALISFRSSVLVSIKFNNIVRIKLIYIFIGRFSIFINLIWIKR